MDCVSQLMSDVGASVLFQMKEHAFVLNSFARQLGELHISINSSLKCCALPFSYQLLQHLLLLLPLFKHRLHLLASFLPRDYSDIPTLYVSSRECTHRPFLSSGLRSGLRLRIPPLRLRLSRLHMLVLVS